MSRSIIEFFQHIKLELDFLESNSKNLDFWDVIENEIEELNFQITRIIKEERLEK